MRTSEQSVIAISTQDHKLAALFFDRVAALHSSGTIPVEIKYDYSMSDLISRKEFTKCLMGSQSIAHFNDFLAKRLYDLVIRQGGRAVPIFHSKDAYREYLLAGPEESVEIILVRAPIIDGDDLEWVHVMDVRSDKDTARKLRSFRLFLSDNYKGKDEHYIRDSLHKKLEDYEAACRKHGLKLLLSTLCNVFSSKSLLGALGLATVGTLTGNPVVVSASVVAGAVLEIGKISVHVAEKKLEFEAEKRNSEIAYLVDIHRKAEESKNINRE